MLPADTQAQIDKAISALRAYQEAETGRIEAEVARWKALRTPSRGVTDPVLDNATERAYGLMADLLGA